MSGVPPRDGRIDPGPAAWSGGAEPDRDAVFAPLTAQDPQSISGYLLRARIGEGGMGAVYLSYTPGGRPVAIKVARSEFAADPGFRGRFAKEVAIAQRVQGPCTVPVVDFDADAVRPWIATAYVAAPSLAVAVGRQGALPAETVLVLMAGVAEALQSIHRAGVIHRDLKPGNVILAADGPRVIDFGVARAVEAATVAMTQTGVRIGTPAFMAPEQVQGKPLDTAGDVFALGGTAYFAATGRPPFGADAAVFHRIEHQQPDWDRCPDQVRDVLQWCLHKDPVARPTSTELIDLCRSASTDDRLRMGESWLPPTVNAELTRYSLTPPAPPPLAAGPSPAPGPSAAPARMPGLIPEPEPISGSSPPADQSGSGAAGSSRRAAGRRRTRAPWLVGGLGAVSLAVVTALLAILLPGPDDGAAEAAAMVATASPTPEPGTGSAPTAAAKAGISDGSSPAAASAASAVPESLPPGAGEQGAGGVAPPAGEPRDAPSAAAVVPPAPTPTRTPAPAPQPSAAPTSGSECPGKPSPIYNGDGYGILVDTSPLRSGHYAVCDTITRIGAGKKVWLWCSVVNRHNHLWWWVRLDGTSTQGWMWDGNLKVSYVDDNKDGKTRIYSCDGTFIDR